MKKGKKSVQSTLAGSKPIAMRESRSEGMSVTLICHSLMSAAIGHRPTPSVDEDLQKLYNEVWAGFSDEPGAPSRAPSAQDDLDNIYSVYGTEPDHQPSSTTPVSPASARSCAF